MICIFLGAFEDEKREITYNDLYCVDLKKLDEWKTLIEDDTSKMEWLGSDSESDEEEDSEESEDDDSSEMDTD